MFKEKFKRELLATLRLSIPIIIAQLGVVLMGVTDNIMVGRFLGKVPLGAAGIANTIAFLIASFSVGGMSVIAPMVSKCVAESEEKGIKYLFSSTLWVAFIYSVFLSLVGFLVYHRFDLFQQPDIINKVSPPFLLIILASNIPLFYFLALKQFADGLFKPELAMYITAMGLVLNLIGNYVLITGAGIITPIGILGSAYATCITRVLMAIALFLFLRYNANFKVYFRRVSLLFNKKLIWEILQRSIPGGAQVFFEIAAFSFAVIMMGWISETALAAHQIAISIASTTYMMATGFSFAGGIRVGEAWGLRAPRGIRIAGFAAYFWVFAFMLSSMILILIFDKILLSAYINDADVIQQALPLLSIAAIFQLSDGIQVVGLGVLRGLADIKIPTLITFLAYWVVALPLGYFLGFHFKLGSIGIWLGLLVGLTISAVLLYIRFTNLISLKNLKKRFVLNE